MLASERNALVNEIDAAKEAYRTAIDTEVSQGRDDSNS
jgi:hypothetical protein